MTKPDDYIKLPPHGGTRARNMTEAVLEIIERVYDQPFTGRQITEVLLKEPRWSHYSGHSLYGTIRRLLHDLARQDVLAYIERGGPGHPALFRNPAYNSEENMLFLTRSSGKPGKDTILIGDDIKIVVRNVRGQQVSLGIEAPPDVTILREEVKPHE